MCLPSSDQKSPRGSMLPLIALMLGACLAGPALGGIAGAIGAGAMAGIGAAIIAVALCVALPAALLRFRRRGNRSASHNVRQ